MTVQIRDRILELRRVPASELQANPANWRRHPDRQRQALRSMLESVGYAGAVLARKDADGRLVLIDGHLRAETTPEARIPVLVVDVPDADLERTVLALACNADQYWTTREIADFVGRSRRQVYRILAKARAKPLMHSLTLEVLVRQRPRTRR